MNREQLARARALLRRERQVVDNRHFDAIDYGTELFDAVLSGDVRAVLDFMGVAFRETKMCVVHGAPHDHHMITEKCRVAVRIETVVEDSE